MLDFLTISPAMASAATVAGGGFGQQLYQFLPLVLIFVAFYFFLIRPQQKKAQQQREMLSALSKGDQVLTSGGILGKIVKVVSDEEVLLEISDGVQVRVVRSMITQNLSHTGSISSSNSQSVSRKKGSNVKSLTEAKKKSTTRRKTK
ncbi:MAG: preprotein translocase subunit YajC [Pseudomonadota bacterium]